MKLQKPNQLTLRQLKATVYEQYQVISSQELKKVSALAARLDLRYKQSWNVLIGEADMSSKNVISLASHVAKKDRPVSIVKKGLESLSEDLKAFSDKIESDFAGKTKASQKYRESLTYL